MNTSKNFTPATFLTPDDFVQDAPFVPGQAAAATPVADLIDRGVRLFPSPLVGEGARAKRGRVRGSFNIVTPHPAQFRSAQLRHPLPQGERGRKNQTAFFSVSARSVFSHEKPPSASGVRPKWP